MVGFKEVLEIEQGTVTGIKKGVKKDSLTSIVIPYGVTDIGYEAFSWCEKLTSVVTPEGVKSLGAFSFKGCSALTALALCDGVTKIDQGAFFLCTALKSLTVPKSVTEIGYGVFTNCALTSLKFDGTAAQWNAISKNASWKQGSKLVSVVCNDVEIKI